MPLWGIGYTVWIYGLSIRSRYGREYGRSLLVQALTTILTFTKVLLAGVADVKREAIKRCKTSVNSGSALSTPSVVQPLPKAPVFVTNAALRESSAPQFPFMSL